MKNKMAQLGFSILMIGFFSGKLYDYIDAWHCSYRSIVIIIVFADIKLGMITTAETQCSQSNVR